MHLYALAGTTVLAGMTLIYTTWLHDPQPDVPHALVGKTWDAPDTSRRLILHSNDILEPLWWSDVNKMWFHHPPTSYTLEPGRIRFGSNYDCNFTWKTYGYVFHLTGEECGRGGMLQGMYVLSEYRLTEDGMANPWWASH